MKITAIGFIGLGLIGGSIARGLRKIHPEYRMIATSHTSATLEEALCAGVIDEAVPCLNEAFSGCDLIFLCAPVSYNIEYLKELKEICGNDCLITDVGSTKGDIHRAVADLHMEENFIGGHPMAGSEKTGFTNSTDHLVENAWYVLTPTKKTAPDKLKALRSLVEELGALPLVLDCEEHDYIVAAISHLPHLIASGLVNLIRDSDNPQGTMRQVAAGGFKDITRIASSSPVMCQQICMTNSGNIARILKDYIKSMEQILEEVENRDETAVYRLFETSRDYRNSIPDTSMGPLKKEYSVYCDIIDQAGAIATIATILATHQISIRNIGIIHNREFEEGVLKIEFYEEPAAQEAAGLLTQYQYTVHKR